MAECGSDDRDCTSEVTPSLFGEAFTAVIRNTLFGTVNGVVDHPPYAAEN
jgi:hypothetical protein